jgi:hypothetical protein
MMQQLIENCHAAYQRFNELTAALDRGEDVVAAHEDASAALRCALMDVRHALNVWFDGIEADDALAQVERVRGALTARHAAARQRVNWPLAGIRGRVSGWLEVARRARGASMPASPVPALGGAEISTPLSRTCTASRINMHVKIADLPVR